MGNKCSCCKCCNKDEELVDKPPPIYIKAEERKCTDVCFCGCFIIFWIVMLVIMGIAAAQGNSDRLMYGTDYQGNICGHDQAGVELSASPKVTGVDMTSRKFIYYPRIVEDIVAFAQSGTTDPLKIKLFGVCMSSCPQPKDTPVVCTDAGGAALDRIVTKMGAEINPAVYKTQDWKRLKALTTIESAFRYAMYTPDSGTAKGGCWHVPLPSKDYFYRCLWQRNSNYTTRRTCSSPESLAGFDLDLATGPDATQAQKDAAEGCITAITTSTKSSEGEARSNPLIDQFFNAADTAGRYVGDLQKAKVVILVAGGVFAIILGFIFIALMRKFAGFMVFMSILLCIILLILCTAFAYWKAGILTNDLLASKGIAVTLPDATGSSAGSSTGVPPPTPDQTNQEEPSSAQAANTVGSTQTRWKYFAWFLSIVTLIVILLCAAWFKRIRIATAVIREAANAVNAMPSMLILPITTTIALFLLLLYFLLVGAMIASVGSITPNDIKASADAAASAKFNKSLGALLCPLAGNGTQAGNATHPAPVDQSKCAKAATLLSTYEDSNIRNYLLIVHFFGFLWTAQFIIGFGIMVVAGMVSKWYFTRDKSSESKGTDDGLPNFPLKEAIYRTARFHMGSIAFGSAVIAIVQLMRAVLAYLSKNAEELKKKNKLLKAIFCCLACCLWCFEKILKFVTSYAYILIAMQAESFCTSCRQVVGMILSNPVQIGLVNVITTFLFVLGKIFIVCVAGFAGFQWMDKDSQFQPGGANALVSMSFPLLVIMLIAWAIASVFLDVFGLSVDTILLCFLKDKKLNDGSAAKPYYMSEGLLDAIGASVAAGTPPAKPSDGTKETVNPAASASATSPREAKPDDV